MDSSLQRWTKASQGLEIIVQATIADGAYRIERGNELLALVVPEQVLFQTEGDELTPTGLLLARQLGTFLNAWSFDEIRVVGPVDLSVIVGSLAGQFLQKLAASRSRAMAVVRSLQESGVDAAKLSADMVRPYYIGLDESGSNQSSGKSPPRNYHRAVRRLSNRPNCCRSVGHGRTTVMVRNGRPVRLLRYDGR